MTKSKRQTVVKETRDVAGAVIVREIFVDGKLQDGFKGQAAVEEFRLDGSIMRRMRYTAGEMANGSKGEPAIEEFDATGKQTYEAFTTAHPSSARRPRRQQLKPIDLR